MSKCYVVKRYIIEHYEVEAGTLSEARQKELENPFWVNVVKETCKLDPAKTKYKQREEAADE